MMASAHSRTKLLLGYWKVRAGQYSQARAGILEGASWRVHFSTEEQLPACLSQSSMNSVRRWQLVTPASQ